MHYSGQSSRSNQPLYCGGTERFPTRCPLYGGGTERFSTRCRLDGGGTERFPTRCPSYSGCTERFRTCSPLCGGGTERFPTHCSNGLFVAPPPYCAVCQCGKRRCWCSSPRERSYRQFQRCRLPGDVQFCLFKDLHKFAWRLVASNTFWPA